MNDNGREMVIQDKPVHAMALPVTEIKAQIQQIQQLMKDCMKEGEHHGIVPGTDKPTLLKAGAEKLCLMFRLDPEYEITKDFHGEHMTVTSRCTLYHITTSQRMGSGFGMCSTKESKYAYRNASRKCPQCGKEAIIKGKEEYGGGWVCFKKKDGCGAKFKDDDSAITSQEAGKVANEQLADIYNTVLKMANKRSLVAAVLNVTAASDIFTQDLEDIQEVAPIKEEPHVNVDKSTGEILPKDDPANTPKWAEPILKPTGKTKTFIPKACLPQEGGKSGKMRPFKVLSPNNEYFSTYDGGFFKMAEAAMKKNIPVVIEYAETKFGMDIKNLGLPKEDYIDETEPAESFQ